MRERLISSCEDVFRDELIPRAATEKVIKTEEQQEDENENENEEEEEAKEGTANPSGWKKERSDLDIFLSDFDVGTKTDEITKFLEENEILKATFTRLAATNDDQAVVTYADFWSRYFYRIADDTRLVETYRIYFEQNLVEKQQQRLEASSRPGGMGLSGMTSFLGGVVGRLTKENENENENHNDDSGYVDESMDQTIDDDDGNEDLPGVTGPATRTALGFLKSVTGGGRPPFVMNTAVSDSDDADEDGDDDDDDSEEELGWDDDDEIDVDDDDDDENEENNHANDTANDDHDDDDGGETTVEYMDAEKERLLEELEQARAERDSLHKTVEMQTEELKKMQKAVPAVVAPTVATTYSSTEETIDTTQRLQIKLFEKDSELAALRARLEDNHEEDDDRKKEEDGKHQEDMSKLNDVLSNKDSELNELQNRMKKDTDEYQRKLDERLAEKEEMRLALQSQIYALERQQEAASAIAKEQQDIYNQRKHDGDTDNDNDNNDDTDEKEELREVLVEKDIEIASLRTRVEVADELRTRCDQTITEKEELRIALQSEIDLLQQELVSVKEASEKAATSSSSTYVVNEENELLRTEQLAEKDVEINTLKKQLYESQIKLQHVLEEKEAELRTELQIQNDGKEQQIKDLQQQARDEQDQKEQHDKTIIQGLQSDIKLCVVKNKELQSNLDLKIQEIIELKQDIEYSKLLEAKAREEAEAAAIAIAAAAAMAKTITATNAAAAAAAADSLTTVVETTILAAPPSPGSISTGEKVHHPSSSSDDDEDDDDDNDIEDNSNKRGGVAAVTGDDTVTITTVPPPPTATTTNTASTTTISSESEPIKNKEDDDGDDGEDWDDDW
jgi:hypothetical protein